MILFPVYDLIVKFNMYTLMYEHTLLFFFFVLFYTRIWMYKQTDIIIFTTLFNTIYYEQIVCFHIIVNKVKYKNNLRI